MMQTIRRLNGMQDVLSTELSKLRTAESTLQSHLSKFDYKLLDTPLLEETELFLRKSGGELASRMYTFIDQGGRRVSLRPEFTASVIRAFMDGELGRKLPLRVQYAGPVFRYSPPDIGDNKRQFSQVGAEFLGDGGPAEDAEILAIAAQGLVELGIPGVTVTVGHMGVMSAMLEQIGLSERARVFIMRNAPRLRSSLIDSGSADKIISEARDVGLLRDDKGLGRDDEELAIVVRNLGSKARGLVKSVLKGNLSGPTGQRSPEEILNRYLRQLQSVPFGSGSNMSNPEILYKAIDLVQSLATVSGPQADVLNKTLKIMDSFGLKPAPMVELQVALTELEKYNLTDIKVSLDLGLTRGIAYYTGMVFDISTTKSGSDFSLGGGGRYDGLVTALGGKNDVPAIGFAYAMDRVVSLIPE
jgi:histidyl-tRNA synthetase